MQPLVDSGWLAARLGDSGLRIVDVRWYLAEPELGARQYREGHIPGAAYLDVESDLSGRGGPGRHPLPDPAAFARRLGEIGIGDSHTVVAYDDASGAVAARLWWMLRRLGHAQVTVLDGGFRAWSDEALPVSSVAPDHPVAVFTLRGDFDPVDRADVWESIGRLKLIDVRAGERYRGETEPVDAAAGHIPGALNVPYSANVDSTGRFVSPERLRALYGPAEPTIAYCGSGVTACHTILAHVVAGLPEPHLYEGSWSDWSSHGLPVATGPDPGTIDP